MSEDLPVTDSTKGDESAFMGSSFFLPGGILDDYDDVDTNQNDYGMSFAQVSSATDPSPLRAVPSKIVEAPCDQDHLVYDDVLISVPHSLWDADSSLNPWHTTASTQAPEEGTRPLNVEPESSFLLNSRILTLTMWDYSSETLSHASTTANARRDMHQQPLSYADADPRSHQASNQSTTEHALLAEPLLVEMISFPPQHFAHPCGDDTLSSSVPTSLRTPTSTIKRHSFVGQPESVSGLESNRPNHTHRLRRRGKRETRARTISRDLDQDPLPTVPSTCSNDAPRDVRARVLSQLNGTVLAPSQVRDVVPNDCLSSGVYGPLPASKHRSRRPRRTKAPVSDPSDRLPVDSLIARTNVTFREQVEDDPIIEHAAEFPIGSLHSESSLPEPMETKDQHGRRTHTPFSHHSGAAEKSFMLLSPTSRLQEHHGLELPLFPDKHDLEIDDEQCDDVSINTSASSQNEFETSSSSSTSDGRKEHDEGSPAKHQATGMRNLLAFPRSLIASFTSSHSLGFVGGAPAWIQIVSRQCSMIARFACDAGQITAPIARRFYLDVGYTIVSIGKGVILCCLALTSLIRYCAHARKRNLPQSETFGAPMSSRFALNIAFPAVEQAYLLLYGLPLVCDVFMSMFNVPFYLPHFMALIALLARSWLDVLQSRVAAQRAKLRDHESTKGLRRITESICQAVETCLCLFPLNFLYDGFRRENTNILLFPSPVRLIMAFVWTLVRDRFLLSPVAWVSCAVQVLLFFYLRDIVFDRRCRRNINSWCWRDAALDFLLLLIGMASLRFLRDIEYEKLHPISHHGS